MLKENTPERRQYDRDWYAALPAEKKRARRSKINERRRELRRRLIEYKTTRSCSCGEKHPACLQFHHVDDRKEINLADAVKRGWSWARMLKEIAKCVVICGNCHAKLHWEEPAS